MSQFNIEDIARYAEGLMEPEEKLLFESTLSSDDELRQQLALYRETHDALQHHFTKDERREELAQTLQQLRGEFFPATASAARVVSFKKYWRSAAAIAAIAVITVFVWQPWQTDLYQQYADTQMISSVERGDGTDSVVQKATIAFNQKEFSVAAPLLQQALAQEPDNSMLQYYLGIALLQSGKEDKARPVLTQVYNGTSAFKYEAAFYMALSYLKVKDKNNCRQWLQRIPADAGAYPKAQELLKKL